MENLGLYNLWEVLRRPEELAAHALLGALCALVCLIAIWAGVSRRHWFVRAAVVCGALALFVPAGAAEPLLFFAVTLAMLIVGWRWAASRREWLDGRPVVAPRPSFRFRLDDLLLAVAVTAVASWLMTFLAREGILMHRWWKLPIAAALLAAVSSAAVALVESRRPRRMLGLLGALIAAAAAIHYWLLPNWMYLEIGIWRTLSVLLLDYAYFAFVCFAIAWIGRTWTAPAESRARRRVAQALSIVGGIPLLAVSGWIYWRMLDPPPPLPPPPAGPNALPVALALGAQLMTASPAQTKAICDRLLPLLEQPGFMPRDVDAARAQRFFYSAIRDYSLPKHVARLLAAEGEQLAASGNHDRAADFGVAITRLGQMTARGGDYLDTITGIPVEQVGLEQLLKLRRQLSDDKRHSLVAYLYDSGQQREPLASILARGDAWELGVTERWRHRLRTVVWEEMWGDFRPDVHERVEQVWLQREVLQRLLSVDLALRSYREDHPHWPLSLAELVPAYLPELPLDPHSQQALIYRSAEPEFMLYSVGWDSHDDGGKLGNRAAYYNSRTHQQPGLDLDLDTFTRP